MPCFGLEVEKDKKINSFIQKTNRKLKVSNILTNPFMEDSHVMFKLPNLLAVYIEPIYPNFASYGMFFSFFIALVFVGFSKSWAYVPSLVFGTLSLFWNRWFYYAMMRAGIRKEGYKGKMKMLSYKETIKRLM